MHPRPLRLLVVVALAALLPVACKKKDAAPPKPVVPELALDPVDKTNPLLIAGGAVPSLEGTLDEVGRISKTLGLPFGRDEVRTMAAQRTGLPEDVVGALALDKPIGFAVVGRGQAGADPWGALAISTKGGDAGKKVIAALGAKSGGKDDAVEVKRPDGSKVWLVERGGTLVASDSLEGLVAAGAQALAARTAVAGDDLVVRLSPDGLAKSQGTDVKTAMADFQKKMADAATAQGGGDPAITQASFAPMIAFVADVQTVDLGLRIDEKRGVSFFGRAHPKAGSQLEKDLAGGGPATIDPALLVGPAPAVVTAMSHAPWLITYYRGYLKALSDAKLPLGGEVDKLLTAFEGAAASSGVGRMGQKGLEFESVMNGKDNAGGAALLDAVGTFMGAPAMKEILARATRAAGGIKITWKKQGETGRLDVVLPKTLKKDEVALVKSLLGGTTVSMHFAGKEGRMVSALGPNAPTRVKALLAAPAAGGAPWPEIASVLGELAGEHGYVYFDLLQLMRPVLTAAAAKDPSAAQMGAMLSMPMFADLRLPIVESWRGGKAFDFELRLPMMTLTNAATAARPFLGGAFGGAAPGGAATP